MGNWCLHCFLQCKMHFRFLPNYLDFSELAPFFFVHQTSVSDIRYVIGETFPTCLLHAHAKTWFLNRSLKALWQVSKNYHITFKYSIKVYKTSEVQGTSSSPKHDLRSIDHVCKCKERHHPDPNPPPTPWLAWHRPCVQVQGTLTSPATPHPPKQKNNKKRKMKFVPRRIVDRAPTTTTIALLRANHHGRIMKNL